MGLFRKIWSAISTLVVVCVVLLAVALVGVRLVELQPLCVLSGSMEPTYPVGSLIYVKHIDAAQIQAGTPITFVMNEDLMLATHRVVDVEMETVRQEQATDAEGMPLKDENGNPILQEVELEEPVYYYRTKGDANEAVDGAMVRYENVVGTPVFFIPWLGYAANYLQNPPGTYIAVSAGAILLLLVFLPDLFGKEDGKKKKRRKAGGRHSKKVSHTGTTAQG